MKKTFLMLISLCGILMTSTGQEPILVKDINPFGDSRPRNFYSYNETLFFVADDSLHGAELWKSDGTDAGTMLVKDIWPGQEGGWVYYLQELNGKLFFSANDSIHNSELWVSDGTEIGTYLFMDISPGGWGEPKYLTAYEGLLYFTASNGNCDEPWVSDGTVEGTYEVKDIATGTWCSDAEGYFGFNGLVYFTANDVVHNREPWFTDATAEGTVMLKDIYPGSPPSVQNNTRFTEINGMLYFAASDGISEHGRELWVSDGTSDGTYMLKDIYPGLQASNAGSEFVLYDGLIYFKANDGIHGNELWVTDGTTQGTMLFKDISPGSGSSTPWGLTVYNEKLYFRAWDKALGCELFVCDGTVNGTYILMDINPDSSNSLPSRFFEYNGLLYFHADDGTNGLELWVTDGSEQGTCKIVPGNATEQDPLGYYNFDGFLEVNDILYFSAKYNSNGTELYKIDYGTHVEEAQELISNITIYPIPVRDKLSANISCSHQCHLSMSVYSLDGRLILSAEEAFIGPDQQRIEMSLPENLPAGMYILQCSSEYERYSLKFLKE